MLDAFLLPFEFEFFRNGLLVATIAGGLCGLIGVYVVLRSMSYIGHGLSHAIFGGFAASSIIGVNALLGAGVWGFAAALAINTVTRRRPIGADAAIGVITTASFAFGLALFAVFGGSGGSFDALLFGSILGVAPSDVLYTGLTLLFAITVFVVRYRSLAFVTFDAEVAEVSGIRVQRLEALMMLVLATSILVTMKILGVTLIAATLVIPPTVARMMTNSFSRMLFYSATIGAGCGMVGMIASYHLNVQSGPTIVLAGALLFGIAYAVTGAAGLRRAARLDHHEAVPVRGPVVAPGR